MKKYKKYIFLGIVSTMLLCGGISSALAGGKVYRETNPFVTNYYVEPINQGAPFFDVPFTIAAARFAGSPDLKIPEPTR